MKYTVTIEANTQAEVKHLANMFSVLSGSKPVTEETHTATGSFEDVSPSPNAAGEMRPAKKQTAKKKSAPVVEDEEQDDTQETSDGDSGETNDTDYTLEDITKALQKYCKAESKGDTAKGRAAARKVLKKFKVDTPEDLDPSDYANFMDAIT